jgi:hypothetical protein
MAKGIKTGGGSRKGVPNKINAEFRETVRRLLEDNSENVGKWLTQVAGEDPAKALDLLAKLAEFAAPKLSRTEMTGPGGGPVQQSIRVSFE